MRIKIQLSGHECQLVERTLKHAHINCAEERYIMWAMTILSRTAQESSQIILVHVINHYEIK